MDGFVLQLQYSFPQWLFYVVYQVEGVTTTIFCYLGQSFKNLVWYSINRLTKNCQVDRGPLRLFAVMIEDLVVGFARDGFAILKAWGHEGDARLRLISVVVLKGTKVLRHKKVRVLLVSKNNTLGQLWQRKKIEEEALGLLCRIKRGNRPWICIHDQYSEVRLSNMQFHALQITAFLHKNNRK